MSTTTAAPADQPELIPDDAAALASFATFVSTDGRLVRLTVDAGCLTIGMDQRKPVVLDRWQTMAARAAFAALPAGDVA